VPWDNLTQIKNYELEKVTKNGSYSGQNISSSPNLTSVPAALCSIELVPESFPEIPVLQAKNNKQKETR
jgi:hypothetical protein